MSKNETKLCASSATSVRRSGSRVGFRMMSQASGRNSLRVPLRNNDTKLYGVPLALPVSCGDEWHGLDWSRY